MLNASRDFCFQPGRRIIMAQTERESKVQRKTMDIFRKYGCYVYKNAQNIFTEKGRPDLTACVPVKLSTLEKVFGKDYKVGMFVGVELKRDGHLNEVSDAQEVVGRQIKRAKGLWLAIDDPIVVEALLVKLEVDDGVSGVSVKEKDVPDTRT